MWKKELIEEGLAELNNDNAAGEFYLTDLVSIISNKGFKIKTYMHLTMRLKVQQ